MIIKTGTGKSFGGCVNYLTEDKKEAEILHVEGVRMDTPQHMIEDFNQQRKVNPDLGKAVWHTSVSFPDTDKGKINNELMKNIAQDYAKKFGLEQYAVIKHNDKGHEHFHLVGSRVKYDGKTVSDQFAASRGVELSHKLEKKYELNQDKTKHLDKTNIQALSQVTKVKYEIYEAIQKDLPSCKTIEELKEKLQAKGIETQFNKQSTGKTSGVSFKKGDFKFKGSEIDKKTSIGNINKTIENALKKSLEKGLGVVPGVSQTINAARIIKRGIGGHSHEM